MIGETLPDLTALGFGYAGCAALALAMPRHRRQLLAVPGRETALARRSWRAIGALMLALGVWAPVGGHGLATGLVAAFGLFSAAAIAWILLLTYYPQWGLMSGWMAAVLGVVGYWVGIL